MSDTNWTKEQKEAIETRNCNLLVAAAAGSGKTAVLVERIIRIISNEENPVDIDRLLVVTFTNAAAAEMRERIGDAISKALDKNPESKILQRQLTLLNKSKITTMHSFCLDIIRNNFHRIDLDPDFRIADSTEEILLKSETIDEFFEEKYKEAEENTESNFLRLVEAYGGGRSDAKLKDIVINLYKFVMSGPWPEKWIKEAYEAFNVNEDFDFKETKWGKVIIETVKLELFEIKALINKAIDMIKNSSGLELYLDTFNDDMNIIDNLILSLNSKWEVIKYEFENCKFSKLKTLKKNDIYDEDLKKKLTDIRNKKVKEKIKQINNDFFNFSNEEIKEELIFMYPLMKELGNLILDFNKLYTEKKRERGILDFNDLEHLALSILTAKDENDEIVPSEIALEFRKHFDEILVDEYQDSNLVQEVIINMVSRKFEDNPNVFMVGDIKQSIYRFRQAVPELFLEKYENYSKEEGSKNRVITLYKNFRSRSEIIDGVNYIFKSLMSKNIGELEYTDKEALNLGADYKIIQDYDSITGGPIEIHIIEKKDKKEEVSEDIKEVSEILDEEDEEESLDNIQIEARVAARRIKELIMTKDGKNFKVFDKSLNDYRNLQYRDIVVLLRATKDYAAIFVEEFEKEGIPVYADTGNGYFETIEIRTMMSLLQIIDNPLQDIPLIAVLRSPIFSFTPEELIDIRLVDNKVPFYIALKKFAESSKNESNENTLKKVKNFLENLENYRDKAQFMPIDELIWYLFTSSGYYGYVGAMPGGVQRQANLRILFERARQFEKTSYRGLFNFVNFINKLKNSNGDMGSAKILGENENVVRIMSIHKSKGLEFPVVILSSSGKNFNMMDLNNKILYHQKLGIGPEYINPEKRIQHSTIIKMALKNKIKLETLSEEIRILYVAFTRAKEKLIITGMLNDIEASLSKWCDSLEKNNENVPEYAAFNAKSYLEWIVLAILKHKDGEILRNIAKVEDFKIGKISSNNSRWEIKLWDKKDVVNNILEESVDKNEGEEINCGYLEEIKDKKPESKFKKEVERRLSFSYKYTEASKIPAKLSVTELKRLINNPEKDEYTTPMFVEKISKKPAFLEERKGLSAAERGTVLHFVMQHIDLKNVGSFNEIDKQIKSMVLRELLTEEQAKTINIDKILNFFKSPIGKRMLKVNDLDKDIEREVAFHIRVKSTEINNNLSKEIYEKEETLLMGVIDCFFKEEDGIVLLDYKTDYITKENMEEIKKRYERQIYYYAKAIESIIGEKPKEKYIYLFSSGEIIKY
ncbi:DNA helicase/exodeoxyribonuclease V, subunit A [Clostridium sp. USBA 49]|uniref:helicase-exonuclease AddAB subunit AddA n=1 Tax=Clostridium sp. USBA 49 TaxID=1881060 RepID=UPI00099951AF|nr:helicase-exonuclease AddAB subunit AddA [Clostridium sp. USBA 49]SKA89879.1 DNA helicase/exodeoxyribonuclease V, subunit A [Clostridium sp. USBA 49]